MLFRHFVTFKPQLKISTFGFLTKWVGYINLITILIGERETDTICDNYKCLSRQYNGESGESFGLLLIGSSEEKY